MRKKFKCQMLFHEYFFVLYVESELTDCSSDADRVILRINKFKQQFPRMVSLCNIKQSKDYFERWKSLPASKEGDRKKVLDRAIELA